MFIKYIKKKYFQFTPKVLNCAECIITKSLVNFFIVHFSTHFTFAQKEYKIT